MPRSTLESKIRTLKIDKNRFSLALRVPHAGRPAYCPRIAPKRSCKPCDSLLSVMRRFHKAVHQLSAFVLLQRSQ